MIQRLRIGILAIVLGFLCLHFLMVWLHINPFRPQGTVSYWGEWYCSPFFSQGWTLFTPVPRNNYMIFVEYEKEGKKIRREIFQSLVQKHRTNRFAGLEPFVVAFVNSIHYFYHTTPLQKPLNGPISGVLYFDIVEHTARRFVMNDCDCDPKNFSMVLLIVPHSGGQPRAYYSDPKSAPGT
jgi:hypothetical protein